MKVAWGSIVTPGHVWELPAPAAMYWGPDLVAVEYQLTSPYLAGEYAGWCSDWAQGSDSGDSFWVELSKAECWQHCEDDLSCWQAVYEEDWDGGRQCWTGTHKMTEVPDGWSRPEGEDFCYAKRVDIEPVSVREEKFISANDVVVTTIVADKPVTLKIEGRSYQVNHLESVDNGHSVANTE